MRKQRIIVAVSIATCAVVLFILLSSLTGCSSLGEPDCEGESETTIDTYQVADPDKTYTVGNAEFTAGEVADYVNTAFSHSVYYHTSQFNPFPSKLDKYLENGGKTVYDLYLTEKNKDNQYGENRYLLVEIDGDTLPDECSTAGYILYIEAVLNSKGVQSASAACNLVKKDEISSLYETNKAEAEYMGSYALSYIGKPDESMYVSVSEERAEMLRELLEKSVNSGDLAYAKIFRGKYTVSVEPIFACDDYAPVILEYENGGVFCARWAVLNNADEDMPVSLMGLSYYDELGMSSESEHIRKATSEPICTFEIVKQ